MDPRQHWENIYQTKAVDAVSWYAPHLAMSLALIQKVAKKDSAIIDVGAGASTLVDDLLSAGYQELTVLDISEPALACTKKRLGSSAASQVKWIAGDITSAALPLSAYDVWHDRAVFHFLTNPGQRAAYVRNLLNTVKNGGHIVISTFAANGPMKCSGLEVVRYDSESLSKELGPQFHLLEASQEVHSTPFGTSQNFLYCLFQKK